MNEIDNKLKNYDLSRQIFQQNLNSVDLKYKLSDLEIAKSKPL